MLRQSARATVLSLSNLDCCTPIWPTVETNFQALIKINNSRGIIVKLNGLNVYIPLHVDWWW